jgi:hypothetical protein
MRLVLSVVLAMGLLFAGAAWAATFSDVPDDHWAYEALDYLQEAGLVEGYPDGTFRGDRAFTRYEMAMVIARIFTKIQDWQALMQEGGTPGGSENVDMAEVNARLDKLADEFRDELDGLGARVTAVEDEQAKMKNDMSDMRALLKDSGLSGVARWRVGGFVETGSEAISNEPGVESYISLNYKFQPDPNLDFNFSLTSTELEGPAGTGFIPGANNETGSTSAGTPPFAKGGTSSSFVLDQAYFKYYWDGAPELLGDCPRVTGGRQYFSQGEFGMAGDNGYRSNYGLRLDTDYGKEISAHAGIYRTESMQKLAPWANSDSDQFQSSGYTTEADDYLLAGLEYHSGEATIPGHDYKLVLRADGTPNGYGAEKYVSVSGNAEIPWFSNSFINGIRGEWVYLVNNASNQDPSAMNLTNNSFIVELDLFNDGRSRVSLAAANIAQLEGLPVYANIDNDPFSEWDFSYNDTLDAFNLSREGRNYFPADFSGFGLQAEHTIGNSLHATLTYYNGKRVDATASDRPGLLRLNLAYPFSDNSTMGIDLIAAGERNGMEDPIALVRGEYKLHF